MFTQCITCEHIGKDCMESLLLLPLPELLKWWNAQQRALGWSNQTLSDKSHIAKGTIDRIRQGEYDDCRYSTIRSIMVALIGGTAGELPCKQRTDAQQQLLQELEQEKKRVSALERENEALRTRLENMYTFHRDDVREICAEYKDEVQFLKDVIRSMQILKL